MVAVGVSACGSSSGSGGATAVKFQLNFVPYGGDAPIYLAVERGYYRDEGLDVTILPGKTGVETISAVANGQVDFGTAPDSQVISAAGQGATVVSVGNRFAAPAVGVIVDSRLQVNGLADLAGKRILSSSPVYAELLKSSMRAAGVDPGSVELVTVNGPALLSTYAGGEGEGLVTSVPFALPVVSPQRESDVVSLVDYGVTIPEFSFIANPAFVDSKAETGRKFLSATYRGMDAAMRDPQAAIDALMAAVPGIDEQAAMGQMLAYGQAQCSSGTNGKTVAYQDLDAWKSGYTQMMEIGAAEAGVDISRLVTNEFQDATSTSCPTSWSK
ncbi:ABC transporter substrate-binding protein [Pseudonocardia sp. RS010]|uniref:ABC transporter substrate-binding protein n=1 Tax=Pseudonocardia sp. RS010 TaxID=3385979 RepID=UPI00399FCF76